MFRLTSVPHLKETTIKVFSSSFDLCELEVLLLSVLTEFLSNLSQFVVMDGCRSKLVIVVSGMPQGSVLCSQLFLLYTTELFPIIENKLYG